MSFALKQEELVPLCTLTSASNELNLNGEVLQEFQRSEIMLKKINLITFFHLGSCVEQNHSDGVRGLFLHLKPIDATAKKQDSKVLNYVCVLQGVNLREEPFWFALTCLVSSQIVPMANFPLDCTSFVQFGFLSTLTKHLQFTHAKNATEEEIMASFTAISPTLSFALQMNSKDSEALPTKEQRKNPAHYVEKKLNELDNGMSEEAAVANQVRSMIKSFFQDRTASWLGEDKKGILLTIEKDVHFNFNQKRIFGRQINAGLMATILQGCVHFITTNEPICISTLFEDSVEQQWSILETAAFQKFVSSVCAKIEPYKPVRFTPESVVALTKKNLETEKVNTIDNGQGSWSAFDEFGNLRRDRKASQMRKEDSLVRSNTFLKKPSTKTLDIGLFKFLEKKVKYLERAMSTALLSPNKEEDIVEFKDKDGDEEDCNIFRNDDIPDFKIKTDLLLKFIRDFDSHCTFSDQTDRKKEKMPLGENCIKYIGKECSKEAYLLLKEFSKLGGSNSSREDYYSTHMNQLKNKVKQKLKELIEINKTASFVFCSSLLQYLYSVTLKKIDEETHEHDFKDVTSTSHLSIELVVYRNNLNSLASQYNFLAKGPKSTSIMTSFLERVILKSLKNKILLDNEHFRNECSYLQYDINEATTNFFKLDNLRKKNEDTIKEIQKNEKEQILAIRTGMNDKASQIRNATDDTIEQIAVALKTKKEIRNATISSTRETIDTLVKAVTKEPKFCGYLYRKEGGLFGRRWTQYYYIIDHNKFSCYKSKNDYEQDNDPLEAPICISGYTTTDSKKTLNEFKLSPPEAGKSFIFRAPTDEGKVEWVAKIGRASSFMN